MLPLNRSAFKFIAVALGVTLGAQLARVLFPSLAWYVRDTVKPGIGGLVGAAYAPFLVGLAGPLLVRILGEKRAPWVAGIGLALARIFEQLSFSPGLDLWLAMAGMACFLWWLPQALRWGRETFIYGLAVGLAVDLLLKTFTASLDWSWLAGTLPVVAVVALAGAFLAAQWENQRLTIDTESQTGYLALPLLGVGPLFFIHWLTLNNLGWAMTVNGYSTVMAAGLMLAAAIAGIIVAHQFMSGMKYSRFWMFLAILAIPYQAYSAHQETNLFVAALTIGLTPLLVQRSTDKKSGAAAFVLALGKLLMATLALLYYLALDLPLPFEQEDIRLIAGITLGVIMLAGLIRYPRQQPIRSQWEAPVVAIAVLLGALLVWRGAGGGTMPAAPSLVPAASVRVMSYNLHSGFSTDGRNNPEEIAKTIEAAEADIVGLQELSRGWLIDGGGDLFLWLQRRLNMPYAVFGATADPVWGNAILSRYPIVATEQTPLPRLGTRIPRGVTAAQINLGNGEELLFMTTHLHHRADDLTLVHLAQLDTIITQWDDRPRTLLVGDMNARPGWVEMDKVLEVGFEDSWANAGIGDGFTSNAANPKHRIDWIFHTSDLVASDAEVIHSQASDHFPVAVTISLK